MGGGASKSIVALETVQYTDEPQQKEFIAQDDYSGCGKEEDTEEPEPALEPVEGPKAYRICETRKKVLCGAFEDAQLRHFGVSLLGWRTPRFKLVIFVSSTFTDTHRERNVLLENIRPLLRDYGSQRDVDVSFVDMRWGVRDENTLDHRTLIECANELERCRTESTGLFFLSLQGDKYGYQPIPKTVPQAAMDARLASATTEQKEVAARWYSLDTNSVPPEYVLRNLKVMNDEDFWNVALPVCRELLEEVPFWPSDERLLVGRSVTEWEVTLALKDESEVPRSLWLHRTFQGGVTVEDDPRRFLFDAHEPKKKQQLDDVKAFMGSRLKPAGRVTEYLTLPVSSYNAEDEAWQTHLGKWEVDTKEALTHEVAVVTDLRTSWEEDGLGVGMPGAQLGECLHHAEWAAIKASTFTGREDIIAAALDAVDRGTMPNPHSSTNYPCTRLALVGRSGAGKTAAMAKIAACLYSELAKRSREDGDAQKPHPPVIVRFCGTSPGSSTGIGLMRSIAKQIMWYYAQHGQKQDVPDLDSTEFHTVKKGYETVLLSMPAFIFIDSIDQLSDADMARSQISFLKGVRQKGCGFTVVSMLPDERDKNGDYIYCYGCHTRIMESPEITIVDVPLLKEGKEVEELAGNILAMRGRALTKGQWVRNRNFHSVVHSIP